MAKGKSLRKRIGILVNRMRITGPTVPLAIRMDATHTAMYVRISSEPTARTLEVQEEVLADYDRNGALVGFEIIGFESPGRKASVPATMMPGTERAPENAEAFELEAALV